MQSALSGEGIDRLLGMIDDKLGENRQSFSVDIPITDGKALAWLYRRGQVLERKDTEKFAKVKVALEPEDIDRFNSQFDYKLQEKKKPRSRKKA